jgi:hypothetical protein
MVFMENFLGNVTKRSGNTSIAASSRALKHVTQHLHPLTLLLRDRRTPEKQFNLPLVLLGLIYPP